MATNKKPQDIDKITALNKVITSALMRDFVKNLEEHGATSLPPGAFIDLILSILASVNYMMFVNIEGNFGEIFGEKVSKGNLISIVFDKLKRNVTIN